MTEQGQPVPQRIGDAERDRAVELLREHHAVGRLTTDEFDERLGVALSAKTSLDLDPLFTDLPGPRPGQGMATTPPAYAAPPWQQPKPAVAASAAPPHPLVEQARKPAIALLTTLIWPATILLITFGLGWEFWWLIFVPIIVTSALGKSEHNRREDERRRIAKEQAELDRRRRAIGD